MKGRVKFMGSTPSAAPKPSKKAVIEGQGSIPFDTSKTVATPNTAKAMSSTGTKRGMGAAERGGRYTYN
jgi:hypothetical protein